MKMRARSEGTDEGEGARSEGADEVKGARS
jgi:hypothetical protein